MPDARPSGSWIRSIPGALPALCIITLALLVVAPGGGAALLGVGSILALLCIIGLFMKPGEPLILLYAFLFQWLESSLHIFHEGGAQLDDAGQAATSMLLAGLLVQCVGADLGAGKDRVQARGLMAAQLEQTPQRVWLGLYLKALVLALAAQVLAGMVPLLSQPLLVLPYLKWTAYVIFTAATFFRGDADRKLWLAVFLFELVLSTGGYFSSFKFVFIFTFLGVSLSVVRFSPAMKAGAAAIFVIAVLFGSVWSAIKVEYRQFISGGEQAQVVVVDFPERVGKLTELIADMQMQDLALGFEQLLRRIEYVEYFTDVTTQVPAYLPHTLGELWWDAISRPFMPRLFFPNKPVIDESELTREYTGRQVAGFSEGTQISLGYITESYIDFGKYGMLIVLFAWGVLQGLTYRWLTLGPRSRGLLGHGLAAAFFVLSASSIGNSAAKLLGGCAVAVLVYWVFLRYVVPIRALRLREVFAIRDPAPLR